MNRYLSEFDDCLRCEELTLHCKEHSRCLQCQGCPECSPVSEVASTSSLNRVSGITGDPGVSHRADAPESLPTADGTKPSAQMAQGADIGKSGEGNSSSLSPLSQVSCGTVEGHGLETLRQTEASCGSVGSKDGENTLPVLASEYQASPAGIHIASPASSGSLADTGAGSPLGSAPVLTTADHLVQAIAQDEGEKGWNQQQINDIARKMNRMAAGGFNSLEILVSGVEEVLA